MQIIVFFNRNYFFKKKKLKSLFPLYKAVIAYL